jgi:hypothetical protein
MSNETAKVARWISQSIACIRKVGDDPAPHRPSVDSDAFHLIAFLQESRGVGISTKDCGFFETSRIAARVSKDAAYSSKAYGRGGVGRGVAVTLGVPLGLGVVVAVAVAVAVAVGVVGGVGLAAQGLSGQPKISIESVGAVGA